MHEAASAISRWEASDARAELSEPARALRDLAAELRPHQELARYLNLLAAALEAVAGGPAPIVVAALLDLVPLCTEDVVHRARTLLLEAPLGPG